MTRWHETAFDGTHRERYIAHVDSAQATAVLLGIVAEAELGPRDTTHEDIAWIRHIYTIVYVLTRNGP